MYFNTLENTALYGVFSHYVTQERQVNDPTVIAAERGDYLAVTDGERSFPRRVVSVAEEDGELITCQMVYKLSKPCQLEETDCIKPGNVAWDWWNANNIYGVDFRAIVNTENHKQYIDFVAEYGWTMSYWMKAGQIQKTFLISIPILSGRDHRLCRMSIHLAPGGGWVAKLKKE